MAIVESPLLSPRMTCIGDFEFKREKKRVFSVNFKKISFILKNPYWARRQIRCHEFIIKKASSTPIASTKNGVTQRIEPNRIPHHSNRPRAVLHASKGETQAATATTTW